MIQIIDLIRRAISKVFGDLVSKGVSDGVDSCKSLYQNRKSNDQNIESEEFQIIIDVLKKLTHKEDNELSDAALTILEGFESGKEDEEAVKDGLRDLGIQDEYVNTKFLEIYFHKTGINNDFFKKKMYNRLNESIKENNQNYKEEKEQLDNIGENLRELQNSSDKLQQSIDNLQKQPNKSDGHKVMEGGGDSVANRAEEYAEKWNKNVFLNDFNEEDQNAGVNIKLKDIYVDECLPHFIWGSNTKQSDKLKDYLMKYINNNEKKMLLILGQPGIGKSTLITWIMANLVEKKESIFVYQFAADLDRIDWQSKNVLNDIFKIVGLKFDDLKSKTLILDGFDEIFAGNDRERILNKLNEELKNYNTLEAFSLIITCRENYIYNLKKIKCEYIVLQAWDEAQIVFFCRTYWKKCGNEISEDKIRRIMENRAIFGIPLILYMILALNVTVEKSKSIVDVYDQIFSLKKGGIYDRDYDKEHRINEPEIKKYIHQTSQRIAFWMFENNSNKAFIYQRNFKEICNDVVSEAKEISEKIQSDTLIGSYFKIKYCEGIGTDELQFIHRSIYEYFVAVYFFESLYELRSTEEVAGKLGELLKEGHLSKQILEFIKCKFDKLRRDDWPNITKKIFNELLRHGMTYYTRIENPYNNVIERERNIFSNMLEVVGLWNSSLGKLDKKIIIYLQCNREKQLHLSGIELVYKNDVMEKVDLRGADLNGADLRGAGLSEADLRGAGLIGADLRGADFNRANLAQTELSRANLSRANLSGADLSGANLAQTELSGANLSGANLSRANLIKTNLSEANLSNANLKGVDLIGTIFSEGQVDMLHKKYDLSRSRVILPETNEKIDYQEYCIRKQKG